MVLKYRLGFIKSPLLTKTKFFVTCLWLEYQIKKKLNQIEFFYLKYDDKRNIMSCLKIVHGLVGWWLLLGEDCTDKAFKRHAVLVQKIRFSNKKIGVIYSLKMMSIKKAWWYYWILKDAWNNCIIFKTFILCVKIG